MELESLSPEPIVCDRSLCSLGCSGIGVLRGSGMGCSRARSACTWARQGWQGGPTSELRGAHSEEEEQESRLQRCQCQTRHLGEKCPSLLSEPRFIPKA